MKNLDIFLTSALLLITACTTQSPNKPVSPPQTTVSAAEPVELCDAFCHLEKVQKQLDSGNYPEAIKSYDEIVDRYGDSDSNTDIGIVMAALQGKSFVQIDLLGDPANGLATVDGALKRYCFAAAETAFAEGCLALKANSIEPLLISGDTAEAAKRAESIRAGSNPTQEMSAIMPFLVWLAQPDSSIEPVRRAIADLSPEVEFRWKFNAIRDHYLPSLSGPQQSRAQCFITFFEVSDATEPALDACLKGPTPAGKASRKRR